MSPRKFPGSEAAVRSAVRMAVLRHVQRGGEHYDLMLERAGVAGPGSGPGALATWRVMLPPGKWGAARRMELVQLPDHRRAYLRREGNVSGGRGWVWRVDEGSALVKRWVRDEVVAEVRLRGFAGTMVMRRVGDDLWAATASIAKPQAAPGTMP